MPVASKMDPLLAEAEPISDGDSPAVFKKGIKRLRNHSQKRNKNM